MQILRNFVDFYDNNMRKMYFYIIYCCRCMTWCDSVTGEGNCIGSQEFSYVHWFVTK